MGIEGGLVWQTHAGCISSAWGVALVVVAAQPDFEVVAVLVAEEGGLDSLVRDVEALHAAHRVAQRWERCSTGAPGFVCRRLLRLCCRGLLTFSVRLLSLLCFPLCCLLLQIGFGRVECLLS